ncbi:MAG: hypothetical protein QOH98_909, partial [Methylobacteriaceae bacterium]|nr:hypothetical protein [Methylobacteriaceae bacterium]
MSALGRLTAWIVFAFLLAVAPLFFTSGT